MVSPDVVVSSQSVDEADFEDYAFLQRYYLETQIRPKKTLPEGMTLRGERRRPRIVLWPALKEKLEDLYRRCLHGERYRLLKLLRAYETYTPKFGDTIPKDLLTPGLSASCRDADGQIDDEEIQEIIEIDHDSNEFVIEIDDDESTNEDGGDDNHGDNTGEYGQVKKIASKKAKTTRCDGVKKEEEQDNDDDDDDDSRDTVMSDTENNSNSSRDKSHNNSVASTIFDHKMNTNSVLLEDSAFDVADTDDDDGRTTNSDGIGEIVSATVAAAAAVSTSTTKKRKSEQSRDNNHCKKKLRNTIRNSTNNDSFPPLDAGNDDDIYNNANDDEDDDDNDKSEQNSCYSTNHSVAITEESLNKRSLRDQRQWNTMYERFVACQKKHNTKSVPRKYKEDPSLGRWVNTQRDVYRNKKLSNDRIDRLNSIAFVWDPLEAHWKKMYERLVAYKEQNNSTCVPQSYEVDPQLDQWVNNQRTRYNKLTAERKDQLNSIGFVWNALNSNWTGMYDKLVVYKKQHNSTSVPCSYNPQLAKWVQTQRTNYNTNSSKLTKKRKEQLNSIGFVWNARDACWTERYEQLVEYKNLYNSTCVPIQSKRYPELGSWVNAQRRNYNNTNGHKMTDDRISRLNKIGFVWKLK